MVLVMMMMLRCGLWYREWAVEKMKNLDDYKQQHNCKNLSKSQKIDRFRTIAYLLLWYHANQLGKMQHRLTRA